MTGSLAPTRSEEVTHRACNCSSSTTAPRSRYRDVRRFGTWLLLEPGELEPYLGSRLGEEPLVAAFTAKGLGERLEGRRAPLKAALLDQRTLAGLGNIYVDEALWYAKLNPLRPAGSLDRDELRRLHRAIRKALELGIARQGSTLSDYRLPDGSSGSMQREFRAYGRSGEPCDRCGTTLRDARASAAAAPGTARPANRCRRSLPENDEGPANRAPRNNASGREPTCPCPSSRSTPWPSQPWPSRPWP